MMRGEEVWYEQCERLSGRGSIDFAAVAIGRWQRSIKNVNYSHVPLNSAKGNKTLFNFKYIPAHTHTHAL